MAAPRVLMVVVDERETHSRQDLPEPNFGMAPTAVLEGFKGVPQVELHVTTCVRQPVRMPERWASNIQCHTLLVPRWGFLKTAYVPCVVALRKLVRKLKPELVHGQGSERFAAMMAAFSGLPNIITLHGVMRDLARASNARPGSFLWLQARLESLALRRTDGVLCNSKCTLQSISRMTRRTWQVPNALRETFFEKPPPQRKDKGTTLLHVGVITENKQQIEVLRIAGELWRQGKRFQIQFAGAPDNSGYSRRFLEQVAEAEKQGFARYLGQVAPDKLVELFDKSAALVHTPVVESFGLVVAEALARNLNFFGFAVGGVPDIVQGAVGAVLVQPNDWCGLLNALSTFLTGGPSEPAANSALMEQRYHPQQIALRHIDIYNELLTLKSRRHA